ncbi:MAG: PAS domain-containing sensor histidine kinase [Candidatus Thermoplasmatota archaeon]|nr:PAS domain-containing sensor histidine kinase [Candidatus Thermoplasmatota archaeon]
MTKAKDDKETATNAAKAKGRGRPRKDGPKTSLTLNPSKRKQLYDEILESSTAIIIGLDPAGRIKIYNKGAQRALGYDRRSVLGRSWFEMVADPGEGKKGMDIFKWDIKDGFRTRFENMIRSANGAEIAVGWENTILFDKNGEVSLVLMVGQDITQVKALERDLLRREDELKKALEDLSIYSDLMLHDIHNSTAAIMGYLELLGGLENDPERRKRFSSMALQEAKKSVSIMKEIRLLSRIDNTQPLVSVSVTDAFRKAIDDVGREMGKHGVAIETELNDIDVIADGFLGDVLARIFEHFRPGDGDSLRAKVHVRRAPEMSRKLTQPVLITLSAPDTTIPKDMRRTVFTSRPEKGGTSDRLGLYVVRRLIERYGGSIWMDDEPSEGWPRFNILLREAVL